MRALPPVGRATGAPHTRQLTSVVAFAKMTCSFLQPSQRTLMNWLGVRVMSGTLDEFYLLCSKACCLGVLFLARLARVAQVGFLRHFLTRHFEARDCWTAVFAVVAVAASQTTLFHTACRTSAHRVRLRTAAFLCLSYAVLCVLVAVRAVALDGFRELHCRVVGKKVYL